MTAAEIAPRPFIRAAGRERPAFRLCGYAGLACAVALALALAASRGLSLLMVASIAATGVAVFLALATAAKVLTGRESLTYYHHQTAILGATALLLDLAGQPVLAQMDVTILGVGLFLVCGRVGCLLVGCCHGRPTSSERLWAVRYSQEHVAAGFPAYLAGVRLLPVQALEAGWVLGVVAVGCGLVLAGSAPGVALEWYVVAYAVARFGLELLRGDAGRVYLLGFSEAQWTSVALPLLVVAGEVAGALPWRAWTVAAAALPVAAMGALAARRRLARVAGHRLLCPRHVREIAEALAVAAAAADQPAVRTTSLGIRVSRGEVPTEQVVTSHYTLSRAGRDLDAATAKVLAGLIVRLRRQDGGHDVVAGRRGVFHVIVQEAAAQDRNRAVVPPVGGALSRAGPCR